MREDEPDREAELERVGDPEDVALREPDPLDVPEGELCDVPDCVAEADDDADADPVADALEPEAVEDGVALDDSEEDAVPVADVLEEEDPDRELVALREAEVDRVDDALADEDVVGFLEAVLEPDGDAVEVTLDDAVLVAVEVGVPVALEVLVAVAELDPLPVGLGDWEDDAVAVRVA